MVPLADEKGEEAAVVDGVQDARREQVGSESRRDARDGVGREFGGVDRARISRLVYKSNRNDYINKDGKFVCFVSTLLSFLLWVFYIPRVSLDKPGPNL